MLFAEILQRLRNSAREESARPLVEIGLSDLEMI